MVKSKQKHDSALFVSNNNIAIVINNFRSVCNSQDKKISSIISLVEPSTTEIWNTMRPLNSEIQILSPVLECPINLTILHQ